ncbi:MAG: CheR family methyltransferase, partial [Pseudomonadota bacterium]
KFDIIFCRNVLIYFDQPTKKMVLERMADMLPEDGCLLLGAAETVVGITDAFKPVPGARGLYARNPEVYAANAGAPAAAAPAASARPAAPARPPLATGLSKTA